MDFDHGRHVTHRELREALEPLKRQMEELMSDQASNQAAIDAETAKVNADDAKLVTIQQEVDALKAAQSQGQTLDFSALDAALATESTQADTDVSDAAPAPAPTPPAPAGP